MATTPNLGLNKPAFGAAGWDVSLNENFDKIDAILDGGKIITASGVGVVPLTLKGAAGQTADLLKLQNNSGNDLFAVQKDADTTIRNWADQTLILNLDSGATAAQIVRLLFSDRGSSKWDINKDAANSLNILDVAAGLSRMSLAAGGNTIFRIGAGQRFIFEEGVGFNDLFTIEADGDVNIRNFADQILQVGLDSGSTATQETKISFRDQGVEKGAIRKLTNNAIRMQGTGADLATIDVLGTNVGIGALQANFLNNVSPFQLRVRIHGDADKISFGSAADTNLYRQNADILATDDQFEVRSGANPMFQAKRDGDTNIRNWADSDLNVTIDCGATTGKICRLQFGDQGTVQWSIVKSSANKFQVWQAVTPLARLGFVADGVSEYWTGSATAGHVFKSSAATRLTIHGDADKISFGSAADIGILRNSAGFLRIENGAAVLKGLWLDNIIVGPLSSNAAGVIAMSETPVPSAPTTNQGFLYMKDNGSGKTQLVALFPTGVEQIIATEP